MLTRRQGAETPVRIRPTVIALSIMALAFAACGGSTERSRVALDLAPVTGLAASATQDAQAMEQHADAMATAAGGRPELTQWLSEAETIRANAKSLRLLASQASAIRHDPGARAGESTELIRILGDGQNLQQLGDALIAHAGAMESHVSAMGRQTAGDATLTNVVGQLMTDTASMRRDGQAAVDRGKELQESARRLAQSLGQKIE